MMAQHPGYLLSRSCIHDTLLSKRNGSYMSSGLAHSLYVVTIQSLRATQLAPCEKILQPLRFLHLYQQKKSAPEIAVIVHNGSVVKVCSTNPYTTVWVADYDRVPDVMDEADERITQLCMHTICHREI